MSFWPTSDHWSVRIPLDTPHPRLDQLAATGYVVLRDAPFDSLAPVAPLAQQAAALLALVPANRSLCRELGPTWKRGVADLVVRLCEAAERVPSPAPD